MLEGLRPWIVPGMVVGACAAWGGYVALQPLLEGAPYAEDQGACDCATPGGERWDLEIALGSTGEAAAAPRSAPVRVPGLSGLPRSRTERRAGAVWFPPCSVARLAKVPGWTPFLRGWHGLPTATTPEARAKRLAELLAQARDPVVRQNVIFAVALMVPWSEARPWLTGLRLGADADDAEDALVALAFSGDPGVRGAFLALASTPSPAHVKRLVDGFEEHDTIAAEGTREARTALRAWRAIEALDREPYFKILPYVVTHDWGWDSSRESLGWLPGQGMSAGARESLLQAWLKRYPGHPETDGMAVRLGRMRLDAGDPSGAATWFARALAGCDQDRAYRAEAPLMALAETELPLEELSHLASAEGLDTPVRSLFQYARLRRVAAGIGFEQACAEAEALARAEPETTLGWAWRARHTASVPRGLASGLEPLAASDPLLRVASAAPPAPEPRTLLRTAGGYTYQGVTVPRTETAVPAGIGLYAWVSHPEQRLAPARDPLVFDRERLVKQLRCWEALAELERRAAGAKGVQRADLLYKQAAVFYHERDVLFPCYDHHSTWFRSKLASLDRRTASTEGDREAMQARLGSFGGQTFAWERALALFEDLAEDAPDYPAMDKVLFSQAMCWKRLVDYRPRGAWGTFYADSDDAGTHPATQAARRCVELLERLVREHPGSPLADDAARAAAWWRAERPQAFATSATTGR